MKITVAIICVVVLAGCSTATRSCPKMPTYTECKTLASELLDRMTREQ